MSLYTDRYCNEGDSYRNTHDLMLRKLRTKNQIRKDKVIGTKDAIESIVYEDDMKLDIAIDRLLTDINLRFREAA